MSYRVVSGYADALLAVASAEGDPHEISAELYHVADVVAGNDELRNALGDSSVPAAHRQQVVEDLLGGRVSSTTTALVSMIVAAGRGEHLGDIVRELGEKVAAGEGRQVAEVRTAVALSDDQIARLASALRQATGKDVDVRVVIDPSVVGGVVTQIGDEIIDGSVRRRLNQMRNVFA